MNRFNMIFAKDIKSSWYLFRTAFIILCCIPAAVWLFNMVLGSHGATEISPLVRRILIYLSASLVAIMAPSRIYRNVNIPNEGIYYAMLPASKCEKFWSQVLVCYVCMPLAALLAGTLIDIFLTALPFGSYVDWIWQYWPLQDGNDTYRRMMGSDNSITVILHFGYIFVLLLTNLIADASTFFFTNTIFKKNKVAKTILWLLLINFVLSCIINPILLIFLGNTDFEVWAEHYFRLHEWDAANVLRTIFWIMIGWNVIFSAILTWWAGHRLKKMAY